MASIDKVEKNFKKIKNRYFYKYQIEHKKKFKIIKRDFINELSKSLNKLHNRNYSIKQWRILIGPWLNIALNIYFYYSFFNKFFSKNFKNQILSLNLKKNYPPRDYIEFFHSINKKNNQVYFFKKLINKKLINNNSINKNINTFKFKINWIKFFFQKIFNILSSKNTTFLIRPRFKFKQIIKFLIKSCFKILPLNDLTQIFKPIGLNYDYKKRLKFLSFFNKKNSHLAKFLIDIIPASYIENFDIYEEIVDNHLNVPKIIYSDTAHLDDDLTKFFILKLSLNKFSKILIGQHGGNHRIHDEYVTNYNDDYEICNKYLVWGKPLRDKEIKLSSIRLYNTNIIKYRSDKKYDLCYIFEAIRKNQFQGDFKRNDDYLRSLKTKSTFINNLKKNFVVKSYYEKKIYKQQMSERELSKSLNINLNRFINSRSVIFESKIIVLDYLSTMIFELINSNIPFILILDKSNEYLSNFGKKFIQDLGRMKLFYTDPEKAAKFINNLPSDDKWWFAKINQQRILKLKMKYAYVSENHLYDWYKYLK